MSREAEIQDAIRDLIKGLIAKKFRFNGLDITDVKRGYPVGDNRETDLALFIRGETPFMFIETKREGKKSSKLFDPLDVSVVGQVMSYATIYKKHHDIVVPFVATANPSKIAVFKTPENIEDYVDKEAIQRRDYKNVIRPRKFKLLLKEQMRGCEKLGLNEEYIQVLLGRLAREYLEKRVIKVEPTEALIGRFREFVDRVAERCRPLVKLGIRKEPLKSRVEKLGYKLDPKSLPLTTTSLTRMMTYVLTNKITFCKILEKGYGLPNLISLDSSSLTKFKEQLSYHFRRAVEVTGDFEPIFSTGVYDLLPIPDDPELMEYINDFIFTLDSVDITEMGGKIGDLYEELIPPEERHQLGQFYTPPWVCEFITKWCVRGPEDVIFDPGVGSGGFLLRAYERLREEKLGPTVIGLVKRDVHERIFSQLYAVDINPFPAHLSAMGLSMKNVKVPSTKMNVVPHDFFSLKPEQKILTPYIIAGELRREFVLPKFDAVIGNPPYTRWTEIPEETQELIRRDMKKLMRKYGLTPQVSRGVEPGIYTYWIMHANSFLKEGGRLGMIISNTWLQTDYGIGFGNFLLDHFRIKAIVDIALKLFKGALITTCIVLAEKESDETKRLENEVAFIHIPSEVESADIKGLLDAIKAGKSEEYSIRLIKQREIPRDKKWIEMFFKPIVVDISTHPLVTRVGELFEFSDGNATYLFLTSTGEIRGVKNVGSDEFYYLSPSKTKEYELEKWAYPNVSLDKAIVYPAITGARQATLFTFTEKDWKELHKSDNKCYMFVCHNSKKDLSSEVANYIKWGETECKTRIRGTRKGGRLANETEAAKARTKEPKRFYGWYDLGGVIPAAIFTLRRAWRKSRFTLCEFPVAMDDSLETLVPKKRLHLNDIQTKAILAYLNSSFAQLYIETRGIKSPGGVIGFEGTMAREMPILDVRKLNNKQLNSLAKLFNDLERETRKIGGASRKEELGKLKPKIYEIDRAVAALLSIKDEDVKNVEAQVDSMVERRVSVARRAT